MSATLKIRDDGPDKAVWMPSTGIFNGVLQGIAEELDGTYNRLAEELRGATEGFPYFDLSELDAERFRAFLEAAEQSFNRAMSEWPDSIVGPTPALMFLFSQFKALLRLGGRAGEGTGLSGWITMRDKAEWHAPGWVYDLALEHLAAEVRLQDQVLAENLLKARTSEGGTYFDMSLLAPGRFRALLPAAQWMDKRYGDGKARDAYAPAFFSEVGPRVVELHKLMRAMPRGKGDKAS